MRTGFGYTQATAAAKLGVCANTLRAWEQDRDPGPTMNQITLCARLYNTSAIWLFSGK